MNKAEGLLLTLALMWSLCILISPEAIAAPRTIVVPDDFSTINAALSNAREGDTIFVKKGTYHGPVNETLHITESISIIGENANGTEIVLHPSYGWTGGWNYMWPYYDYENAMEIEANDVNISGLTISADGGYIYAPGDDVQIKNSIINRPLLVNGLRQNISGNIISKEILLGRSNCTIAGNLVVGTKIRVGYGYSNLVYNNTVVDGEGIDLFAVDYPSIGNLIFNNTVANCSVGIRVNANGGNNTFYANNIIDNDVGLRLENEGENTTFFHNNIVNNRVQFSLEPQVLGYGYFDNGREGNYWSDYVGNDSNKDGIGDTPYVINQNLTDNFPLMQPFEIENSLILQSEPDQTLVIGLIISSIGIISVIAAVVFLKKRRR